MGIPNSILNNQLPMGVDPALSAYPSFATLRPVTHVEDTTGQDKHTFADSTDPQYINIPCRMSPLILIRPQVQEVDNPNAQHYQAKFQLNLSKYIAIDRAVLSQYQVKVDGSVYQILSIDADGNNLTTRFGVSDTIPFVD